MQNQIQDLNQNQPPKKELFSFIFIKTLSAILIFTALAAVIIGGWVYVIKGCYKNEINNKIIKPANQETENYYDILEKKCVGSSCCLASLKHMKENNYKEVEKNGKCPSGFKANGLKCESSYGWCEPIEKNGVKDEIEKIALCEEIIYKDSKDGCYYDYAMSRNNVNLCGHIIDNAMKENCYSNLGEKNKIDIPVLWALGSEPDAISITKTSDVLFTTMQTGTENKANKIIIEQFDVLENVIKILGDLNDNGIDGDLLANDYVYSGIFNINSLEEGNLFFRAKADFSDISEPIYTESYKLGVTRFPIGIYPSDMSKVIINPKTGEKMISNEVIVGFIDETNPDVIENIINIIDGEIVGTIFGISSYQIKIYDTGDAAGVNNAIDKLLNYPEVEYAEPNYITEVDLF